jgi:mRNA-degrading endonuclease toxin of MazEF toxin-antitoxin module
MNPGDICLANFPFGAGSGMKLRPVLLLTGLVGTVPEVLVAYISSVQPPAPLPSDVLLDPSTPEHRSTNLKSISVLRLHKLATIHQRSVVRHLGQVSPVIAADIAAKLRTLLNL